MDRDGSRHGGHVAQAARWEPRTPALLREILAALRTPEPAPQPRETRHGPLAAALEAESAANPAWTHAVAFRTCRPVRMGINDGWDYYLFPARRAAEEALLGDQSAAFAEPELWERDARGWYRAI